MPECSANDEMTMDEMIAAQTRIFNAKLKSTVGSILTSGALSEADHKNKMMIVQCASAIVGKEFIPTSEKWRRELANMEKFA